MSKEFYNGFWWGLIIGASGIIFGLSISGHLFSDVLESKYTRAATYAEIKAMFEAQEFDQEMMDYKLDMIIDDVTDIQVDMALDN